MHHTSLNRIGPPHTRRGWWSLGLLGASIALFGAFFALVASGQRGGDSFLDNLWLSGTIVPAAALAVASGAMGLTAAVKDGERSIAVLVAMVAGLLVALFVVAEIAIPH